MLHNNVNRAPTHDPPCPHKNPLMRLIDWLHVTRVVSLWRSS